MIRRRFNITLMWWHNQRALVAKLIQWHLTEKWHGSWSRRASQRKEQVQGRMKSTCSHLNHKKKTYYELQSLNILATQTLMCVPFMHNTFRVWDFWSHIDTLEIRGRCHFCNAPETVIHLTGKLYGALPYSFGLGNMLAGQLGVGVWFQAATLSDLNRLKVLSYQERHDYLLF
jgi:hypothetical protein